ncbi:MAG TPA: ABC transporter substrate-binding protein, partial [Candidatus Binatia bacterium]
GVSVAPIGPSDTLFGLLLDNQLDAVMAPNLPGILKTRPDSVRRLFPNCAEVEKTYFRKHGIFPIMHTIVLRKDIYQTDPSVAGRIFALFKEAKEDFYRKANAVDRTYVFPWLYDYWQSIREVLGEDPFPYGMEKNRRNVEKYFDHAVEQSLIPRRPKLEDLFLDLNE